MPGHPIPAVIRFWSKVDISAGPDSCWPWLTFCDKDGYGVFMDTSQKNVRAHRFSWQLAHPDKPIPDGMFVCHNCPDGDNEKCVNPAHLWLGTNTDNQQDASRKGQLAFGTRNGRYTKPETTKRGEQHGMSKLTEAAVREIRQSNEPSALIAARFGLKGRAVRYVREGITWKHVK